MQSQQRLTILRQALLALCDGDCDGSERALAADSDALRDPPCLNLLGVLSQARGEWREARRWYGRALRANRSYLPAEQNLRRIYELETFGATRFPIAAIDRLTLIHLRNGCSDISPGLLDHLDALKSISPLVSADATMPRVKANAWDWRGYAWAVGLVAAATAIGWPLVHSALHLANVNILMLYLLVVLWIATHYRRGAAVLASALGVATFDFVFVTPYYTFAVADDQYIVTFAVMLLTALVISTLTDRMRKEQELARQAWERVETEFLRNTLLSGVSHELRTPLAAITGAASTLIQSNGDLKPHTRGELLESIRGESDRMERLITNLLDMTRLESGGLVLKKEWQPLHEVVGSTLHHLDRRLSGRIVKTDLPSDLPMVQIDSIAIEQVLANLIDNALEYSPADGAIEVRAGMTHDYLVVEVADEGPGLPAGAEHRVFEKFFRADRGQSRRGIGLGLAIARGIVEAHGGEITAMNRPQRGALVRFTLPLAGAAPLVDARG